MASSAQFSARMARLMRGGSPSLGEVVTPVVDLRECEEVAAVSGLFDPGELAGASEAELGALAAFCSVVPVESGVRWLMAVEARGRVLQRLVREGGVMARLAGALPATDAAGEMLRRVLRGGFDVAQLGPEEGKALETALEWLKDVPVEKPDVKAIQSARAKQEFFESYEVLLERGFVGREGELAQLRDFLLSAPKESWRWDGALLTGLGGTGKSTLLAKFSQEARLAEEVTLALLDFDRPGVDAADTYWMEMEIVRQAGYQLSSHEAALKAARVQARELFEGNVDAESSSRHYRYVLLDALRNALGAGRTFLLVLDTFEEVTQRDLTYQVLEWLNELHEYLRPLKVIFSGRLFEGTLATLKPHVSLSVELDVLPVEVAEAFLLSRGVEAGLVARVVASEVLPLRFLELKLIARLLEGGDVGVVEMLERDAREHTGAMEQFFASLVYRRVLNRIPDAEVRELAYPGLILRYLDADLIQKVLAPVLGLPALLERRAAEEAARKLAGYEWLAYVQDGKIWHRKDLRRSMLQAMIAKEPERTRRIQDAAISYFLSLDPMHAEVVYHRLMQLKAGVVAGHLKLEMIEAVGSAIRVDVADLPAHSRALLKLAMDEEMSVAEVVLVPAPYRAQAVQDKGESLVVARHFGLAAELAMQATGVNPWEIEAFWATVHWDRLLSFLSGRGTWNDRFEDLSEVLFFEGVMGVSEVRTMGAPGGDTDSWSLKVQRFCMGVVLCDWVRPEIAEEWRVWIREISSKLTLSRQAEWRMALAFLGSSDIVLVVEAEQPFLDVRHLERMAKRLKGAGSAKLEAMGVMAEEAVRELAQRFKTVRGLLGMSSSVQNLALNLGRLKDFPDRQLLYDLMRFPTPEFRDPVRYAWLEAFPDGPGQARLCDILFGLYPFDFAATERDVFLLSMAENAEFALESYVELADRTGVLREALDQTYAASPSPKLKLVSEAFARWQAAERKVIFETPA